MSVDPFSSINSVRKTVHIALPSLYISNEIVGVTDILESWKRQYVPQLGGILVNYKNVSLASNTGYIVVDKPVVHYNVKATFEIFCPKVGSIVEGKVNRVSFDYIGCLIHNTINVAIRRTEQESEWLSKILAIDNIILFRITCFDYHRRVVRVKGEICDECINTMKNTPSFCNQTLTVSKNSKSTFYRSDSSEDDTVKSEDETQSQSLLVPKHSFKKIRSNVLNKNKSASQNSPINTSNSNESDFSISDSNSSKNKSKKIIVKEGAEQDIDSDNIKVDFAHALKKSPKKKKKSVKNLKALDKVSSKNSSKKDKTVKELQFINESPISSLTNMSFQTPKNKKKRKKDQSSKDSDLLVNVEFENPNLSKVTESLFTTGTPDKNLKTPKKKKIKSEKDPQNISSISDFISTNQSTNFDFSISSGLTHNNLIKDELLSNSPSPLKSVKKKKKSIKTETAENDIDSMIDALAAYEPSLEDQLSFNESYSENIKDEPVEISDKKGKKRKRESDDKGNFPNKKKNAKSDVPTTKIKNKSKKKKLKSKDNIKDDSHKKKGKKNKSKDKSLKFKKDKMKNKKDKDKKKKSKKHSKDKSAIKSEF